MLENGGELNKCKKIKFTTGTLFQINVRSYLATITFSVSTQT
jgi:hypothetical protein